MRSSAQQKVGVLVSSVGLKGRVQDPTLPEISMARQWRRYDGVTSRIRLRGHDYSSPGIYFITLCTEHRTCLFGTIEDEEMALSPAGLVIESWWGSIPAFFPDVALDAMVVMPNHVHGLNTLSGTDSGDSAGGQTLGEIMRWFKSHTTHDYTIGVRLHNWERFDGRLWQPRFYDHIVRSDRALDRIRTYIAANPCRWSEDEYNVAKR
jgi:REP element-mobilizing transposase RayT